MEKELHILFCFRKQGDKILCRTHVAPAGIEQAHYILHGCLDVETLHYTAGQADFGFYEGTVVLND